MFLTEEAYRNGGLQTRELGPKQPLILYLQTYNSKTNIFILLGIFYNYGSNLTRIHWCNSMDNVRQVPHTQPQIEDCIFNNTSADFGLISADLLLQMIRILKELRFVHLNGIYIHFLFFLNLHSLNIRCNTALSIIHFICI